MLTGVVHWGKLVVDRKVEVGGSGMSDQASPKILPTEQRMVGSSLPVFQTPLTQYDQLSSANGTQTSLPIGANAVSGLHMK